MKNLIKLSVAAFMVTMATSCCNCKKDKACNGSNECPKECVEKSECQGEAMPCPGMNPEAGRRHGMGPGRHHGMRKSHHRGMNPEQMAQVEKWMTFDSLSVDEQKALIAERKAAIDKREAEIAAMRAEKKARMEEINEKWKNFDKLSVEEQKELIDMKSFKFRHARNMHPRHGEHNHGPRN
mgnify:CR=1 FL=1